MQTAIDANTEEVSESIPGIAIFSFPLCKSLQSPTSKPPANLWAGDQPYLTTDSVDVVHPLPAVKSTLTSPGP